MANDTFLLSPARCTGRRAALLTRDGSTLAITARLRAGTVTIGEAFTFLSGLYFRGKLSYARAFARPPEGVFVITPTDGLRPADEPVNLDGLRRFASVDIEGDDPRYRGPLDRDAHGLARRIGAEGEVILLGSIASGKYIEPLLAVLGERLRFPLDFVGRGDMSRGGLLLRCVRSGEELPYVPVEGAVRHGPRPPKLTPIKGILK
jgi:hypothetical protein